MPVGKDSILRAANSTINAENSQDKEVAKEVTAKEVTAKEVTAKKVTAKKVTAKKVTTIPEVKPEVKKKKEELPFYLL